MLMMMMGELPIELTEKSDIGRWRFFAGGSLCLGLDMTDTVPFFEPSSKSFVFRGNRLKIVVFKKVRSVFGVFLYDALVQCC